MIIHKAVDFMNDFISKSENDYDSILIDEFNRLKLLINRSIKFEFDGKDTDGKEVEFSCFKLPYEYSYFECSTEQKAVYGILLQQVNEDKILGSIIQDSVAGFFEPQLIEFEVYCLEGGSLMLRCRNTVETAEMYNENEAKEAVTVCVGNVIRCCEIMNCSNVELVDNIPSRLKQSRVKKGKTPLFEFKTLHIKSNNKKNIQKGYGTHKSPRVHLRRGHIRHLQSGITTWVQSCMVGSGDGFVHKDYFVH